METASAVPFISLSLGGGQVPRYPPLISEIVCPFLRIYVVYYVGNKAGFCFQLPDFSTDHERDREPLVGRTFVSVITKQSINQITSPFSTRIYSATA